MDETIIEGLKAELQYIKQFLPTTTKDSNNNLKKRNIYVLLAVQVQQLFLTALTTSEVKENKNMLMPYNDEQWNEEEIIDSLALLIQNGNNLTIPLLLASKLPQNRNYFGV